MFCSLLGQRSPLLSEEMLVKNSFGYVQQQRPNQNSTSFFPLPVMRLALVAVAVVPIVTAHTDDSVHARQVFAASSPSNAVASTASKVTFPSRSFQLTSPPFPSIASMEMPLVPPLTTLLALTLLVCSLPIFRVLHSYQMVRCLIACHTPSSYIHSLDATLDPKQRPLPDQIAPIDIPEVWQWIQEVQVTGINIPPSM